MLVLNYPIYLSNEIPFGQYIHTRDIDVSGAFHETVFIWKTAIIKPLLKKVGLDLICKNYRPVSNLSFLSKILKKCALLQFNNHCTVNKLLPVYQSAYREHFSCENSPSGTHG